MSDDPHPDRICLNCGYSLEHLAAHRCPECGLAFDPMDAATFAVRQRAKRGWLIATLVVWCYPIVLLLTPYFAWLLAWATLGRKPQPSLDDPKSISMVVAVINVLHVMMFIIFPAAVMIGFVANIWLAGVFNLRVKHMLLMHLGFILLWMSSIALGLLDPGNIRAWFAD